MQRLTDTLGGLYQLARLGVLTRFDFRGPYWDWRLHTAFGKGYPSSRHELFRSVLEYARWMHRMKRS
ncbi:MAG: hypothetical protein H7210_00995 [Pyrinomonadaceae bacterium]|nr:hypothetical protein [Phycisphaerales bacterium]